MTLSPASNTKYFNIRSPDKVHRPSLDLQNKDSREMGLYIFDHLYTGTVLVDQRNVNMDTTTGSYLSNGDCDLIIILWKYSAPKPVLPVLEILKGSVSPNVIIASD